ncbi:MAG: VIT1/CCC1 transporter family protein [Gammaproteobacteria bacterium]
MSSLQGWHEERQSAWLYRRLAEVEVDVTKRALFSALAQAAERQAGIWEDKIRAEHGTVPGFRPQWRTRLVGTLVDLLGPRALRPVLAAMKVRGLSAYDGPVAPKYHPMPKSVEDVGNRHKGVSGGGNLRAAVFGINDGLVSNTSLIMGVAGASADVRLILTTGIAGLLAGALSMAAGEYVSMRSQREMYESQIALEREELAEYPEEEAEELALIYNARGMEMDQARHFSREMLEDPEHALDTLAREELGLNPDNLGSPWGAALFSFVAFGVGAVVPLIPFLAGMGGGAVGTAAVLAGACLFVVGAALSLFTGRNALWGGARMVAIGGAAGVVTYAIGRLMGVGLS